MLLHIKIGQDRYYENHENMAADSSLEELITHGVNMLSIQINRLYEEGGSNTRWEQNCFDVIENSYDDYIDMLKEFQYFIVEHVTGLTEFEKPVYINRIFTDEETGETGKIVEITETEVKIEMESEYWTYDSSDFEADRLFQQLLESVHETLCSTEYGINEKIYKETLLK